jgi:hypothetical protein
MKIIDYIYSLLSVEEQTTEEITQRANKTLPKGMIKRSRESVLHYLNKLIYDNKVQAVDGIRNKKKTTLWKLK